MATSEDSSYSAVLFILNSLPGYQVDISCDGIKARIECTSENHITLKGYISDIMKPELWWNAAYCILNSIRDQKLEKNQNVY